MASEARVPGIVARVPEGEVVFQLPATNEGVRTGVMNVSRLIRDFGASEDDLTAIELALAEVLNNVVEHAYDGTVEGDMEIRVDNQAPDIHFRILDSGRPMPNGRLPRGSAADAELEDFEQDEGGYGLFMIRQLAKKLRYSREGHHNQLSFRIRLGSERHWENDVML